jgi:glutaredoxin
MSQQIILYSTWGCHLCEQAELLLKEAGLIDKYQVIDIVDDEVAFARYRVAIPVVTSGNNELCWPFDAVQLADWLREVR